MCSDGLLDLYEDNDLDLGKMVPIWSDTVVSGRPFRKDIANDNRRVVLQRL